MINNKGEGEGEGEGELLFCDHYTNLGYKRVAIKRILCLRVVM